MFDGIGVLRVMPRAGRAPNPRHVTIGAYLLFFLFRRPLTLSFHAENRPFLQILPTAAFPFLLQD